MSIIISYRREDSLDVSGRIYDRLLTGFGNKDVFKDVDSIEYGSDFRVEIQKSLGRCRILLAIVGHDWLTVVDEEGKRRLECEQDYVRIEIETAIELGLTVIPVLINNAQMPKPKDLPESLRELSFLHAIQVRPDPDFHSDMDRLLRVLKKKLDFSEKKSGKLDKIFRSINSNPLRNIMILSFIFASVIVYLENRGIQEDIQLGSSKLPSSIAQLPSGDLVARSEGIDLQSRQPDYAGQAGGDSNIVNDSFHTLDSVVSQQPKDVVSAMIRVVNSSAETVSLSNIQVILGGIILVYEDEIADPSPPYVARPIQTLKVLKDSPPRPGFLSLNEVFQDQDTPDVHMEYSIESNSNEDLFTPNIDSNAMLNLNFSSNMTGEANLIIRATDPFKFFADATMKVIVRDPDEVGLLSRSPKRYSLPPATMEPKRTSLGRSYGHNDQRINLGDCLFENVLSKNTIIAMQSSGDLLGRDESHIMGPNSGRPFLINIQFITHFQETRKQLKPDLLVGIEDPRRKLAVDVPKLVESWHFFFITMRAISESGQKYDISSDKAYVLHSQLPLTHPGQTAFEDISTKLNSDYCVEIPLDEIGTFLMDSTISTISSTQAFKKAQICGAVPENINTDMVSDMCYYSNRFSPFRNSSSRKIVADEKWKRSNFLDYLRVLQGSQSELWPILEEQIEAAKSDKQNNRDIKARYLSTKLGSSTH